MIKLTKRQKEILSLIQSHMDATGSPPTRAEIAKSMGFKSPNAAEDHLRALARKGAIELIPGTSRGIRLPQPAGGIPIIEQTRVHPPVLSEGNIKKRCKLERNFFQTPVDYLFHWTTREIPELGILEGDYLAIHQADSAATNEIVLTRQHESFQVKRLQAQERSHLEGVVVGVIRSLSKASL